MRREGFGLEERAEHDAANLEAAQDPTRVLEALTRRSATFTERDLDRFLERNLTRADVGADVVAEVRAAALAIGEELYDRGTGETLRAVHDGRRARGGGTRRGGRGA